MPPTVNPPVATTATFGPESVVRIAPAAASPPSAESDAAAARAPASTLSSGRRHADDAGREDDDLLGVEPELAGERLGGRDGVRLALGAGRRVRDARR